MTTFADQRKRRRFIWVAVLAVVLVILFAVCAVYLNDYYRADEDAIAAFASGNGVTKQMPADGILVFGPEDARTGFVFYPGGKVEYTAYEPLMEACAARGIFCVLLEMPFNLAVLDVNAADGIREQYPEIDHWYIGGHSLGGSMAASYLSKHVDEYEGLILLGSYSTADLSGATLGVLSVYGSEDRVMNREKYDENQANLPTQFVEVVIDGGCHAYFGMYGAQEGDGLPTLTNEKQIETTAAAIAEFVNMI